MNDLQGRQVFISYSRRDQIFARRLFEHLSDVSVESWADWDDIPISAPWWEEIQRGIERTDAFLCILSPSYMASEICNKEILYARQLNKRIIPLLRRPWRERGQPLAELIGEKAWADLIAENEQVINRLNFLFFRKKAGFECQFDAFGKIIDPACDGITSDFDDFEASFQLLMDALQKDPLHLSEHTRLTIKATEWDNQKRSTHLLLRGDDLERAEQWLLFSANQLPIPSPVQQAYIQASILERTQQERAERERQARELATQRQSVNRLRYLVVALVIFLMAAAFLTNAALTNEALAVRAQATQERVALEAQSLGWAANARASYNDGQVMRGLSLAVEAVSIPNPPRLAHYTLGDIAYQPNVIQRYNSGIVNTFAVEPQNGLLLTGRSDGQLTWWDIQTGAPLAELSLGNDNIPLVGFSPDGKIAFAAQSHRVQVWETATQQALYTFETEGWLSDVLFSPDSQAIYIAEYGGIARRWSLQDGTFIDTWQTDIPTLGGTILSISPDGQHLAMRTDAEVSVWDIPNRQARFSLDSISFGAHLRMEDTLQFSPDGAILAFIEDDYLIHMVDADSGASRATLTGHTDIINQLAFSPDGEILASAADDYSIRLWRTSDGALQQQLSGHTDDISAIAFSADGTWLASGGWDESMIIWDLTANRLAYRFAEHTSPIGEIVFLGEKLAVFSSGDEQGVLLRDFSQSTLLKHYEAGFGQLAFSPDSRYILDGRLTIWDTQSDTSHATFTDQNFLSAAVAFSPDGRYALSGEDNGEVLLWEVETRQIWRYFKGHIADVNSVALSRDGRWAAAGDDNGVIIVWDVATGQSVRQINAHDGWISQIDFSPDGKYLISGAADDRLTLWDWEQGQALHTWVYHTSNVIIARFSPDGRYILSGGWDRIFALWDAQTYELRQTYQAHTEAPTHAVFTPDGRYFLTSADDAQVLMWETDTGQIIRRYAGVLFMRGLAISPDGTLFATSSDDGLDLHRLDDPDSIVQWAYQHRLVRELTCAEREQYQARIQCDAAGQFPTRTPYITPTLSALPTASPAYTPLDPPMPTITTTPQSDVTIQPPSPPGRG